MKNNIVPTMFRKKYQEVCEDGYDEIESDGDENEEKGMTNAEAIKTALLRSLI